MMTRTDELNRKIKDQIMSYENRLQRSLHPVQPDPEFITKLRSRLTTSPSIILDTRSSRKAFIIISAGLFSGALLIWLLRQIR